MHIPLTLVIMVDHCIYTNTDKKIEHRLSPCVDIKYNIIIWCDKHITINSKCITEYRIRIVIYTARDHFPLVFILLFSRSIDRSDTVFYHTTGINTINAHCTDTISFMPSHLHYIFYIPQCMFDIFHSVCTIFFFFYPHFSLSQWKSHSFTQNEE